jgi:pyruvyltransferase
MNTKICAYSTTSQKYLPKTVVTLLTIRRWNPDIELFILSSDFKESHLSLLKSHKIIPVPVNLKEVFHTEFNYPRECYFLFAGPDIFHEMGFEYSIYIDGDINCWNDPANIKWHDLKWFAGTSYGTVYKLLSNDLPTIQRLWEIHGNPDYRVQTGVIYFNNKNLVKIDFLNKIVDLYQKSLDNNIPRKGDDSLFSLFQLVYSEYAPLLLDESYNLITSLANEFANDEKIFKYCKFYHFTAGAQKPWAIPLKPKSFHEKFFQNDWIFSLIDILSTSEIKMYFPELFRKLDEVDLGFFWWDSNNVGDLVTPYYLINVCRLSLGKDFIKLKESTFDKINQKCFFKEKFKQLCSRFVNKKNSRKLKLIISAGSIMRLSESNVTVYGSGIRERYQKITPGNNMLVRGPLTRKRIMESGGECPPIYGDPGLIISEFYQPKTRKQQFDLGIIPHFTEYEEVKNIYENSNIIVINMGSGQIEEVLDQIYSCKFTASSSLHGLIFSHAYDIPTRWVKFSNKIFGDDTKYKDYFLSIGEENVHYYDCRKKSELSVALLKPFIKLNRKKIDCDKIKHQMFFNKNKLKKSMRYQYLWNTDSRLTSPKYRNPN